MNKGHFGDRQRIREETFYSIMMVCEVSWHRSWFIPVRYITLMILPTKIFTMDIIVTTGHNNKDTHWGSGPTKVKSGYVRPLEGWVIRGLTSYVHGDSGTLLVTLLFFVVVTAAAVDWVFLQRSLRVRLSDPRPGSGWSQWPFLGVLWVPYRPPAPSWSLVSYCPVHPSGEGMTNLRAFWGWRVVEPIVVSESETLILTFGTYFEDNCDTIWVLLSLFARWKILSWSVRMSRRSSREREGGGRGKKRDTKWETGREEEEETRREVKGRETDRQTEERGTSGWHRYTQITKDPRPPSSSVPTPRPSPHLYLPIFNKHCPFVITVSRLVFRTQW